MWEKDQLRFENQQLVDEFIEYVKPLKDRCSVALECCALGAICDFLGYIEYVEEVDIERLDVGHVFQYYQHLYKNLKESAERWVRNALSIPLEIFMNFLYKTGKLPNEDWE